MQTRGDHGVGWAWFRPYAHPRMSNSHNPPSGLDSRGLPPRYPFNAELEITPREAHARLASGDRRFIVIDVRLAEELKVASVVGAVHLPLDQFESHAEKMDIPEDAEVVTLCHHGVRSLKAALFLRERGIASGAKSIAGGIDLWSIAVDGSVPRYTRSGSVCTPMSAG